MDIRIVFLMGGFVTFGCTKHNPDSCCSTQDQCTSFGLDSITPCMSGKACDPSGTCVAAQCTTSADCTSPDSPICESQLCVARCQGDNECVGVEGRPFCASDGVCVACTSNDQCTASASPICDTTSRSCRGCSQDIECPSDTCVEATGICAASDEVIHISLFGLDSGNCPVTAPCKTFGYALGQVTQSRDVIRIDSQMLTPGATVDLTGKRVIIDGKDTTLASGSATMFNVGAASNVTIEGVTVSDGSSGFMTVAGGVVLLDKVAVGQDNMGVPVTLTGGALTTRDCSFTGGSGYNSYDAITCSNGGVLEIDHSTFQNVPVTSTNCQFTLTRSSFSEPGDGGARVTGGKALIENNVFSNAGPQPDGESVTQVLPGSTLGFNTFVNYYTAADRAGTALRCDATLDVTSNIFAWGQNAINGACVARYSLFDDAHTMPASQNNLLADLATIFTSSTDFHPAAASVALGRGEPNTGVTTDLEGHTRPATTPDIGAYEAQ